MKNVFNWTVGSFFRTFGRIVAYIIIGSIIAFAFSYKPKAETLTPKSTYINNTNHIIGQDVSSFGSNNTYSYSTTLPNLSGEFLWENAPLNFAVSGKAYAFSFGFQYNLTAQKYYDITINFRDRDLRSVVNTSSIYLLGGSSISGLSSNNLSLIGVTNSATSSNNTNKLVVRVYSVQPLSYFVLQIYNDNTNITSVNNFGISSISIQEVDTTNSQEIINNQTNNTQNIINNQNETTQQIIDNQNELLGSKCSNLLSPTLKTATTHRGITYTPILKDGIVESYNISGTLSGQNSYVKIGNLNIKAGSKVTPYVTSDVYMQLWNATTNTAIGSNNGIYNNTYTFTQDVDNVDVYIYTDANITNGSFKIMVSEETTTFCLYGSYSSKLDDTTNAINDVNDTLNDDNVDGATNKATDFFSNFTTNTHGLTSIITAPLSAIQSLTNATCSPLVLPLPYVNKDLTLPCMRDIYVSTFGGFMTLYDTITLGIISYWVLVRIFTLVKDFKNPEHDEVEVMDL